MLAWRPGDLTRRYIAGERARFISPVALYLVHRLPDVRGAQPDRRAHSGTQPGGFRRESGRPSPSSGREIARLEKQRAEARRRTRSRLTLDRKIAEQKKDLAQIEKVQQGEFPIQAERRR